MVYVNQSILYETEITENWTDNFEIWILKKIHKISKLNHEADEVSSDIFILQ